EGGEGGGEQREQRKHTAAAVGGPLPGLWNGGVWLSRCAGREHSAGRAEQGRADAVPEAAPWSWHHGAAIQRRCCERVGVAVFAQQAASRNGCVLFGVHCGTSLMGTVVVRACLGAALRGAHSGSSRCVHVSLTVSFWCWRKARNSTG